ncbi:hypothetical protein B0O80DRAFT_500035 [Mortierella sp. GBAus27b]|nr:hypothetical protein B0O80DRAFT_500035 [Mortierella sp. GBAus27b]
MKSSSTIRTVKDLNVKKAEERLKEILVQCRGLTHLTTNAVYEELFKVLSYNRETMVSFELKSAVKNQYMLDRLWYVLSNDTDTLCMGNLRHLTLKRVRIHGDGGHPGLHLAFVKLCQRLETLECVKCPMIDWIAPVLPTHEEGTQKMPWTLKQAKFLGAMGSITHHARFLKRCTSLEELTWTSRLNEALDPESLQFLIQSRLKILAVDGLLLPDESLAKLIEHLPPTMDSLCLNIRSQGVNMGPCFVTAAAAVTSPSLSFVSLDPRASNLTSTLTQQLLSSCAKIIHLDDSLSVNAVDLLVAPWVMSGLVKLSLTIRDVACLRAVTYPTHNGNSTSHSGGVDRIIYEQLSRLVLLEDLSLGEVSSPGVSGIGETSWIEFSLRHGMGELAALARLRRLDITQLQGLRMGADEGQWICDHWPVLEHLVVGSFHRDLTSHMNLMTYLHVNRRRLRITGPGVA